MGISMRLRLGTPPIALRCAFQVKDKPDYDKVRKAISDLLESEKAEEFGRWWAHASFQQPTHSVTDNTSSRLREMFKGQLTV